VTGSDESLDQEHLVRMAGRVSRRVHLYACGSLFSSASYGGTGGFLMTMLASPPASSTFSAVNSISLPFWLWSLPTARALIRSINAEGIAVLLVEQNVMASLELAHRAYVLENGLFVMHGSAAQIQADPGLNRAYLGM
jgi:hypothetical protein